MIRFCRSCELALVEALRESYGDHFEPFERRNVRLWFAIKGTREPVMFKGDGDQDRPSLVSADRR